MSPELEALIGDLSWTYYPQVHACGADRACDNCRDRALAAIRAVAEATREASEAMLWCAYSTREENAASWRALHAASVLGEALRHDD